MDSPRTDRRRTVRRGRSARRPRSRAVAARRRRRPASREPPAASASAVIGPVTTFVDDPSISTSTVDAPSYRASAPVTWSTAVNGPGGASSTRPVSSIWAASFHTATVAPHPAVTTVDPSSEIATAWALVWSASRTRRPAGGIPHVERLAGADQLARDVDVARTAPRQRVRRLRARRTRAVRSSDPTPSAGHRRLPRTGPRDRSRPVPSPRARRSRRHPS